MPIFGVQLAMCFMTYIRAGAPYVLATGVLLAAPPILGALIVGVGFGLGRLMAPATQALDAVRIPR
jgi:hypothetical protein